MKNWFIILPAVVFVLAVLCSCSGNNTPTGPSLTGTFEWVSGSDTALATASYGTKGTAGSGNVPGSREGAATWLDPNNNLWLFGGTGITTSQTSGLLNDLWKFDGSNWTWVAGPNTLNDGGSYGTLGIPSNTNCPPSRTGGIGWMDLSGNFWLFGGQGTGGYYNDVWKFNGHDWVWTAGPQSLSHPYGIYGTKGVPATSNLPGARAYGAGWSDAQGNFWSFGGSGNSDSSTGNLWDLWQFNVSDLLWTWVGGTNALGQSGVYGTKGVAASSNIPGARSAPAFWFDSSFNMWLFGGNGTDGSGTVGLLDDLWRFDGSNWTWVAGGTKAGAASVYGIKGTESSTNYPGGRKLASGFTDSQNNQWLFAGTTGVVRFADFWKFDGTNWTWTYGSNVADENGTYGNMGTPSVSNYIGARESTAAWFNSTGQLFLFGGFGVDSGTGYSYLNDLWKITP